MFKNVFQKFENILNSDSWIICIYNIIYIIYIHIICCLLYCRNFVSDDIDLDEFVWWCLLLLLLRWYHFRYQVSSASTWKDERVEDISHNGTYVLQDLDPSESYNVYFLLYDNHGNFAPPVGVTGSSKYYFCKQKKFDWYSFDVHFFSWFSLIY